MKDVLNISTQNQESDTNDIGDDFISDDFSSWFISIFPENIIRFWSPFANHHLVLDSKVSIFEAQIAEDVSNACVAGLRNIKDFLCFLLVEKNNSKRRESSWFGDVFKVIVKVGVLFLPFQEMPLLIFIFLQILRKLNRHDELFDGKVVGFSLCFFIDVPSFLMNHFKNILFCNSIGKLTHKQRIIAGTINLIIAPLVTFSKLVDQVLQNEEKEDDESHEEIILDGDCFAVLDFVGDGKFQEEAILASSITATALEIGDHCINGMQNEEYSEEDD